MKKQETLPLKIIHKILDTTVDPVALFHYLKNGNDAFLLESADIVKKVGKQSIVCIDPALKITIKNREFKVTAQNKLGETYLTYLKDQFPFASKQEVSKKYISGIVEEQNKLQDEETRLKETSVFDVLRAIIFKLKPESDLEIPFCGLFGMLSYDAIDYFEKLPKQEDDGSSDLQFYFASHLFIIDHLKQKTYLIANYPKKDAPKVCPILHTYEEAISKVTPYTISHPSKKKKVNTTISDKEFGNLVTQIKQHINSGDVFQCVLSRSFQVKTEEAPLAIYQRLKSINPGPYMFYFETKKSTLLGSSPETCLKVSGKKNKTVEIKPIAGTLPRGKRDGKIDPHLDARLELELLHDRKELAEHCMLLDLARNDIAKVSIPQTRITPQILKVEKYSHVQHLESRVEGKLREDLDALHAYRATMNMGTLTGAPKIKAMELIRKYEKEKRGFYGGAVCYITPFGEFDSCIVIRAIHIKNTIATVRAGAGIVYDSHPEKEADETKRKAGACLEALGVTL